MIDLFSAPFFSDLPAELPPETAGKAACIGSGISSLACAVELRKRGYAVTVFEALPKPGGLMTFVIPEDRLPQTQIDCLINKIKTLGIDIELNRPFNKEMNVKKLVKQGFQSLYLGIGLWGRKKSRFDQITADGFMDSLSFLTLLKAGLLKLSPANRVVIAGGGNSAMHCAAAAVKQGAFTTVLTRSSFFDMTADPDERTFAQQAGACLIYNVELKKILTDQDHVCAVRATGDHAEIALKADFVVSAFGQAFEKPNAGCALMLKKENFLPTIHFMTVKSGVFAGGNVTRGKATLAEAFADGIGAAREIDSFIQSGKTLSI